MSKIRLVNDENYDWTTLACGYRVTGKETKRTLQTKLHQKKCKTCTSIDIKTLVAIPQDIVPLNKQTYRDYERGVNTGVGAFNIQKHYYLPKE